MEKYHIYFHRFYLLFEKLIIHYQYLSANPRFNAPIYIIGDVLGGIAAYDFLLNETRMDARKASTISTPVLNHKSFKQTIVRRSFESTA